MKTLVKKKLTQLFSVVKKVLPQKISHKRSVVFLFSLIVLGGVVLYVEPTHAQGTIEKIGEYIGGWITEAFMGMSEFFIKMAIFFLQYFIAIAQFNNYLDVATVMLGWTMVRDVANMFFVVILLVIAFGTILGVEQYQWNKTLVKLILAAVFINFSNLICGIFIDAAHVFTITFVNAVSATAGGNFIQAFKLGELNKLVGNPESIDGSTSFDIRLFVGALASLLFAILAMCIIAAYAIIMLARMVALWVLVIFSPLAFILQVLPGTQSYAKQWWDKFMKQVLVAPVMVFFLWLTFATAGSGGISNEIGIDKNLTANKAEVSASEFKSDSANTMATSLNQGTTWANMASFFIPLALMIVGINVVGQMGVVGGGLAQSGQAMAKKIAGYATGLNAAKWTGSKAWEGTKKAGAAVRKEAWSATVGDVAKRTSQRFQRWRVQTPYVRNIPILGGAGKIRREKLNEETERSLKMATENLSRTISRPENVGWRDALGKSISNATGGKIGFGMAHLKGIRYDLEAEDAVITKEKSESKRRRQARNDAEQAEIAKDAMSDIEATTQKEEKQLVVSFVGENEENQKKYGEVDQTFVNETGQKSIRESQENVMKREREEELRRSYDGDENTPGEGTRLKVELETSQADLNRVSSEYRDGYNHWMDDRVAESDDATKDLFADHLVNFSKTDQQQVEALRSTWAKPGEVLDENSDEYKEQTGEAIRQLLKDGKIAIPENSTLDKKLNDEFRKRNKFGDAGEGTLLFQALEKAKAEQLAKTQAYQTGFTAFSEVDKNKAVAVAAVEGRGSLDKRVADTIQERVVAENSRRHEEARVAFLATDEGEAFGKRVQKQLEGRAEEVVSDGTTVDKDGNKVRIKNRSGKNKGGNMNFAARQAIAEKIREHANRIEADTVEAQQKSANAEISEGMFKLPFGSQMMMMKNIAEQAQAASDGFIENLKNVDLQRQMQKAGKEIETVMKKGGKFVADKISESLKGNAYARAAVQQELLVKTKEAMTMDQTTLNESAKAYAVEKPGYGISTPSTSLIPLAERLTTDLKTMESQDSAAYSAKQMGYLLTQRKEKGGLDRHQEAFMFGTAMHLGRNGWMDDMITEVTKKINDLKAGKLTDLDDIKEAENLREVFVDQLGIISQKDGSYFKDKSSAERVAKLQHLMASGNDVDFVRSHVKIEDTIKQAKASESGEVSVNGTGGNVVSVGKNDSYAQVMEKMSDAGALYVDSAEDFKKRLERSSEFLQEASSFFKREAINVGHQEYGGHQQYDRDLGTYRMMMGSEASELMASETRKFSNKLKWQYHGLGEVDLEKGALLKVDSQAYNNQMEELTSSRFAKSVPERTRDAAAGYKFGDKIVMNGQYAVIGESEERINEIYGDMDTFLKDQILGQIKGQSEALKYIMREKANHVDFIDSDRGLANLEIAGTDIRGEKYSDFLTSLMEEAERRGILREDEGARKALETAIASSRAKEKSLNKSRGPAERAEATGEYE